jgi:hypothetical protein
MDSKRKATIISAAILSIGILGSGLFLAKSFYYSKFLNRYVTVKGLAERDVKSDLGIWEIDYREVGNDLIELNKRLQHDKELVSGFLKQHGFTDAELSVQPIRIEDRLANVYSQPGSPTDANAVRYVMTSGVRVRSTNVDLIDKVSQQSSALVQQGMAVVFDTPNLSPNPSYYFTQLDKIRPEILADATKSARSVAEQFAKDSGTELKGIQRASQGIFQIMGRDSSVMSADWSSNQSALGSIDKKVRLVTTIDYRLK